MRNFHITFKQALNKNITYYIILADRSAKSFISILWIYCNCLWILQFVGEEVWPLQIPTFSKCNRKPEIVHCYTLSKFKVIVEVLTINKVNLIWDCVLRISKYYCHKELSATLSMGNEEMKQHLECKEMLTPVNTINMVLKHPKNSLYVAWYLKMICRNND